MRSLSLLVWGSFLLLGASAARAQSTSRPASQPTSRPTTAPAKGEGSLDVLFTSDIFGRFAWPGCDERPQGRADLSHLAAAVKAKREQLRKAGKPEPLVLASGSMIRPDVLGNHIFGEGKAWAGSAIKLLQKVGFSAAAVGPYDFGAQPPVLESYMTRMRAAKIPLLAANVTCTEKGDFRCGHLGDGKGRRYLVLQRGELRVGVFSITREDLPQRILARSKGSLEAADPIKTARKLVRLLRQQEGAQVVIVLATLNLESDAPAPVIGFVRELGADAPDLVVADSMFHRNSEDFIARIQSKLGSAIVGTDRFGQHLGHAVIHYRRTAKGVVVPLIDVKVEPVSSVKPDKYDQPLVDDMLRELCRGVTKPLGRSRFAGSMKHDDFTQYVMEIMRNREGAELTFLNESSLADTAFTAGPLTREGVLRAIRTETKLGSVWITGERLKLLLTPFILGRKSGLRWIGLEKKGLKWFVNKRILIDGLHYRVATTKFVADGGDGLIALRTEGFKDSGFSLRRTVMDFFESDGPAALDEDPTIDLAKDFPDPWQKMVLYFGSEFGLSLNNLTVRNGDDGKRYNLPQLTRDSLTSLTFEADLSFGASNRNHAVEADVGLEYGQTWTTKLEQRTIGTGVSEVVYDEKTEKAETLDEIRVDFLYRLNMLRNREGETRWYMPVPYAEATLITEFDRPDSRDYHYVDLGGTAGIGVLPHPYLFVKLGVAFRGELLTPEEKLIDGNEVRTGIYLGYKLRRLKLVSDPRHPLQLESRLDFFMTNLGGSFRRELDLESKLYFGLVPYLHLTAGHTLYLLDTTSTSASVANDVSLGVEFLFDYRHQVF